MPKVRIEVEIKKLN